MGAIMNIIRHLRLGVLFLLCIIAPQAAHAAKVPIFFGYDDRIDMVTRLPDADAYKMAGEHVDIGYKYTAYTLFWTPVFVTADAQPYVLYSGGETPDKFVVMDDEARRTLDTMLKRDPLSAHSFSFWTHIWGAYIFVALIAAAAAINYFSKRSASMEMHP